MGRQRCVEPGCRRLAVEQGDRCRAHSVAFYLSGLPPEQQEEYSAAARMEDLDEEIAMLRVLVRKAARENPPAADYVRKFELLIRAVQANHRISQRTRDNLMDNVLGVIRGMHELAGEEESDA